METPWKVIGFEKWESERGNECVRLYLARRVNLPEGTVGEGHETQRLFYKPYYVNYNPVVGHMIIPVTGYGDRITNIIVVGGIDNSQGA